MSRNAAWPDRSVFPPTYSWSAATSQYSPASPKKRVGRRTNEFARLHSHPHLGSKLLSKNLDSSMQLVVICTTDR